MVANTIELRDLRRLYDIRDLLHLGSNKKLIVCPLPQHPHHHRTPSFSIYYTKRGYQKFRCHGNCGKEGDILDLVGYMKVPGYDPKDANSIKAAIALLTGTIDIHPPKPEVTKRHTLPNGLYKDFLPAGNEVVEYARKRFLTSETLDRFHIGQADKNGTIWMTMPTIHGDRLRGIKMRNLHSKEKARSLHFRDRQPRRPVQLQRRLQQSQACCYRQRRDRRDDPLPARHPGLRSYWWRGLIRQSRRVSAAPGILQETDCDWRQRPGSGHSRKNGGRSPAAKADLRAEALYLPPDPFVGIDDFVIAQPEIAVPNSNLDGDAADKTQGQSAGYPFSIFTLIAIPLVVLTLIQHGQTTGVSYYLQMVRRPRNDPIL